MAGIMLAFGSYNGLLTREVLFAAVFGSGPRARSRRRPG